MTETILAGKNIKKFPAQNRFTTPGTPFAIIPRLPENFFMGNRPGHTGHGNGEEEEPVYLFGIIH